MTHSEIHPGSLKRLLVALYDSLLILAVLFIAAALTLPFTGGEATSANNIFMSLYLLSVVYVFYAWFWTHGGQTLGMRAWKLKLVQLDGNPVTWQQAFIRFITGLPAWALFLFGLLLWMLPDKIEVAEWITTIPEWLIILSGFVWLLLDNQSFIWRDKISGTHVVVVDKTKDSSE